MRIFPLAVVLAGLLFLGSCADDDDTVDDQVRRISEELRSDLDRLSEDIQDQTRNVDLDRVDEATKARWNENCKQLSDRETDEDTKDELTDACGDLQQALRENSKDALERARTRLDELQNES